MLRAVLLDVDFTLFRPGPELGPEGYERIGARHGLTLDAGRYEDARVAALADLQHHPELVHDEEIWIRFTEDIVRGMGGDADGVARMRDGRRPRVGAARELLPLRRRAAGARGAPGARPPHRARLQRPARPRRVRRHHALDVDVCVGSMRHGRIKPHRSIFEAALSALDVRPGRGGDGRRQLRGRHRGRPRARHARDPPRPGRPCTPASPTGSTRSLALPAALGL